MGFRVMCLVLYLVNSGFISYLLLLREKKMRSVTYDWLLLSMRLFLYSLDNYHFKILCELDNPGLN